LKRFEIVSPPPISLGLLNQIIAEATTQAPADVVRQFNEVKVAPYQVRVRFNEELANEHAFWVVARLGQKLLVYDDGEEYFSTGTLDSDGILRSWGNVEPQDRLDDAVADLIGDRGP
jgi:hypothetical protein